MPIIKDPLGRSWDDKKVGWVSAADSSRMAEYRWVKKEGRRRLIYDRRNGMCDEKGRNVKEPVFILWPVLYSEDSATGWVPFPRTPEAQAYRRSLVYSDVSSQRDDGEDYDSVITIK